MAMGWLMDILVQRRKALGFAVASCVGVAYSSIVIWQSFDWIGAGKLYDQMLSQVGTLASIGPAHDTLTFVTIPAKVGTTPVLNLGLPASLHHYLGTDSIEAITWTKVVMDKIPASVDCEMLDSGKTLHLRAQGAYFFLQDADLMTRAMLAAPGMKTRVENADITIVALDRHNKPSELLIRPLNALPANTLFFDGSKFVRLR
jgi:hypothetical protein